MGKRGRREPAQKGGGGGGFTSDWKGRPFHVCLRPHSYGLGYPRQTSPRVTLAEVTFNLPYFFAKSTNCLHKNYEPIRVERQLRWASCLALAGRVTLASGTTFLHINALANQTASNT